MGTKTKGKSKDDEISDLLEMVHDLEQALQDQEWEREDARRERAYRTSLAELWNTIAARRTGESADRARLASVTIGADVTVGEVD